MRRKGETRVIVLAGPGARARQLQLSGAFLVWLLSVSLLPVGGSLLLGLQVRAWYELGATRGLLAPTRAMAAATPHDVVAHATRAPEPPPEVEPEIDEAEAADDVAGLAAAEPATEAAGGKPAAAEAPSVGMAAPELASQLLRLYDVNAARALSVVPFAAGGAPDPEAFSTLKHFMRCRRSGQERDMNPRLVSLLLRVSKYFDDAFLYVISAHRKADGAVTRPTSQHTRGTAADIRIEGVSLNTLARAAYTLGAKGIGIYPMSGFVHLDVRRTPYSWIDRGDGVEATRIAP